MRRTVPSLHRAAVALPLLASVLAVVGVLGNRSASAAGLPYQDPTLPGATAAGAPDEIEDQESRGNAGGPRVSRNGRQMPPFSKPPPTPGSSCRQTREPWQAPCRAAYGRSWWNRAITSLRARRSQSSNP